MLVLEILRYGLLLHSAHTLRKSWRVAAETAGTSPPFGLLNFVMKGVAPTDMTMGDIYKAGLPHIGCDLLVIILMLVFPIIPVWLPSLMQ